VQADVARDRIEAEQLRQSPARLPTGHVHLEQAILCVHVALEEEEIVLVTGPDVGDPGRVAYDLRDGLPFRQLFRGGSEGALLAARNSVREQDDPY
jgi:hypothetical protein